MTSSSRSCGRIVLGALLQLLFLGDEVSDPVDQVAVVHFVLPSTACVRAPLYQVTSRRRIQARAPAVEPGAAASEERSTVEFGLFNSACVLPQFNGDEHRRIMDEVAIVQTADRVGFKYTWATEHHFLTEYSHLSANEVFLGYLAAATSTIHIGSGIFNVTPPVNHPARVAERVAMLDHLSEGRFEFGMGRGSSTTEQKGFGITDPDLTRDMFDEVVGEFRKMWKPEEYPGFDGKFFSMPARNVLPKPYSHAAPADVGRGRQPVDVREGRAHGSRRAVLHDRRPGVGEAARRALQERDRATPSRSATS